MLENQFLSAQKKWLIILLFIGPLLFGLLVFNLIPIAISFALSFCKWNLLGNPVFTGLENYYQVFKNPNFYTILLNTLIFVSISTFLEITVALILALGLHQLTRGQKFFESIFFIPVITPLVAVSLVWGLMLEPETGFINWLLKPALLKPVAWLYEPGFAMACVIILRVWKEVGFSTLVLWTGLKALPQDVFECALLDGAGSIKRFLTLTIPMLSPVLFFVTTVSLINAFQAFDSIYLLTQGGPENSTNVLVYAVFKHAFAYYRVGEASALAYILFVLIAFVTLIQWQLRKKWVLVEE